MSKMHGRVVCFLVLVFGIVDEVQLEVSHLFDRKDMHELSETSCHLGRVSCFLWGNLVPLV